MKFFESLKESLYDIIGYILPGLFILHLLYLPFRYSIKATPVYVITNRLHSPQDVLQGMIKVDSSISYSIAILLIAYLLGHVSIFLSNSISQNPIIKFLVKSSKSKIDSDFDYVKFIKDEVNSKMISIHNWLAPNTFNNDNYFINISTGELFVEYSSKDLEKTNPKKPEKFILNYARAISRFTNHNNLIQKYIAKSNFYSSFCFIFFVVTLDIALNILRCLFLIQFNFKLFLLCLSLYLSYMCFKAFYSEFYRHKKLNEKECYMFLYHEFVEKNKNTVDQPTT